VPEVRTMNNAEFDFDWVQPWLTGCSWKMQYSNAGKVVPASHWIKMVNGSSYFLLCSANVCCGCKLSRNSVKRRNSVNRTLWIPLMWCLVLETLVLHIRPITECWVGSRNYDPCLSL